MRLKRDKQSPRRRSHQPLSSSQSPTFSYYTNRTTSTPEQEQTDSPERRVRSAQPRSNQPVSSGRFARFSFWLLMAVVVVSVVKLLLLSTSPRVVILDQTGFSKSYTQSVATYTSAASSILKSSLANHLKFTIDTDAVARNMQQKFPELAAVSVSLPLIGNRPVVYVSPAQPSLLLAAPNGTTVAVSHHGIALARLKNPANIHVPLIRDESGVDLKTGEQVLPGSTVQFIETIDYQLAAAHLQLSSGTLPKAAPYELDAMVTGKGYVIKWNLQGDAREQAGTLLATLSALGNTTPSSYIDVRVPGRVYYK